MRLRNRSVTMVRASFRCANHEALWSVYLMVLFTLKTCSIPLIKHLLQNDYNPEHRLLYILSKSMIQTCWSFTLCLNFCFKVVFDQTINRMIHTIRFIIIYTSEKQFKNCAVNERKPEVFDSDASLWDSTCQFLKVKSHYYSPLHLVWNVMLFSQHKGFIHFFYPSNRWKTGQWRGREKHMTPVNCFQHACVWAGLVCG